MSYPIRRYPLDPTGRSPENFISGEEHILGPKAGPYHPIGPYYGPFYYEVETFKVYRNGNLQVPGIDYHSTNLISDATARFSKEVCEVLIMRNCEEGDTITLDYQCIGGLFQNESKGLVDLYNAYLHDNRPVDWTNVKEKPLAYPPAYHLHMLSDVVGWEAMIVAIERLINVLSLRNVPAFEALIDWVMAQTVQIVTEPEILDMAISQRVMSLERLLFANRKLNYNAIRVEPRQNNRKMGELFVLDIKTTHMANEEPIFWEIVHDTTFPSFFGVNSGLLKINDHGGKIVIPVNVVPGGQGVYEFILNFRRNSPTGPILTTSPVLYLVHSNVWDLDYGELVNGLYQIPTTFRSSLVWKTPEALFLLPDDYFYEAENV